MTAFAFHVDVETPAFSKNFRDCDAQSSTGRLKISHLCDGKSNWQHL
jgi:hypothetical protein